MATEYTLSLSSDFNEHGLTAKFESDDVINLTDLGDATVFPDGKSSGYQISCVLSEGASEASDLGIATNPVLHFTNKANQIEGQDDSSYSGFTITTKRITLGFRKPLLMEKGWLSFTVDEAPTEAVTLTCARTEPRVS